VVVALVFSVALKVEVLGTGRGVLHMASGARPILAEGFGRVARVAVSRGQRVTKGDLLLELEAAPLQTQLFEADRALRQLDQVTRPGQLELLRLADAQILEALRRRDAQVELLASQEQSAHLYERKLAAAEELGRNNLVSSMNVEEAREALAQSRRSVNGAKQTLMATEQEVASLRARRSNDNIHNLQENHNLQTKRDSLAFSLAQTRVLAEGAGTVEGFHVHPGDVVSAGQTLGRLLTDGGELKAFVLLPERDRAQVRRGDPVRLEVDQYPFAEWGTLKAVIQRIGESPVVATELHDLFGEQQKVDGPAYLVELTIPGGQTRLVAIQPLQSGMSFQARFVLRRQRPITFLLDPLRRWME